MVTVNLADVDYSRGNVWVGNTLFLGREFKFKDVHPDYKMILGFTINFKQLSSESYGN